MPTERAPRHRAATAAPGRTGRFGLGSARAHRATIAATGSVFVALFALALATLPGHKHRNVGAPRPDQIAAIDDSSRLVGAPSTIAPPASVTHESPLRGASAGALPPLSQQGSPPSSSPPASGTSPGSSAPGGGSPAGSTPAPSTPGGTSSSLPDPAQVARQVFDAINASRRQAGVRPLEWSSRLASSAQDHDAAMARSNTLSHQTPGEASFGDRLGWTWWSGENIARSSALTAQAALDLEAAMVNEKPPGDTGHRDNILASNADSVGVAVLFDTAHHTLWLTEDFAQTSLI